MDLANASYRIGKEEGLASFAIENLRQRKGELQNQTI